MATAAIDDSGNATMTARLNSNGTTPTRIKIDAATHSVMVSDNTTGSDNGGTFAATDDNDRPTMFAVSNSDGVTLVALYADSSGNLLINSK